MKPRAANATYKLPSRLFNARCKACWLVLGALSLVVASFATLNLQWAQFASGAALGRMGRFVGELLQPETGAVFVGKVLMASLETLAMSAVGTLLAVLLGLGLALPASQAHAQDRAPWRAATRLLLNALRSTLELHTSGVLGRLFAEAIENAAPGPALALRVRGVGKGRVFIYATLPQILPQLMSYTLYRWENNIRAAAVLGVVGAGGLGQMLAFHMGLFQMAETGTVLLAMLLLVAVVDALSYLLRSAWSG